MSRAFSLALALGTSFVLLLLPFLLTRRMNASAHIVLPFMLLGVSGAFVHGLGFKPRAPLWRWIFAPYVGWILIIGGIGWFAFQRW